ncbi:hypothetical protein DFS33DRAFT_1365650 [Desarmillaria ectypa]|nr:hypothetical protein DFS33DRAFT_1365650 [Desarmillaria ectypa]
MSSVTLSRVALRSLRAPAQSRSIWVPASVKPHPNTDHFPFNYRNKKSFAVGFYSYLAFGFALPFVAVTWQWYKPGGLKNSA